MTDIGKMSMADLVKKTKEAYGMTWRDMADQLGRSDRMIRKIANGETSGESFRTSFTELYERGQVETLTPRRRNRKGELAKVRAKRGAPTKSAVPKDTRGKRMGQVKRGKFSHTVTNLPEGSRIHHVEMPKSLHSEGRRKGLSAIKSSLQRITKSQARTDKRVKFSITVEDSDGVRKKYEVGAHSGFHASDVYSDIRTDHGGNVEGWLAHQLESVYPDMGKHTVVAVDMNEHSAWRTKPERKQEDAAGTRRHRWRR